MLQTGERGRPPGLVEVLPHAETSCPRVDTERRAGQHEPMRTRIVVLGLRAG
jgi:hypothetical protein